MQYISVFKQKILEFIDFKKIKKSEFYRITGITRGVLDHTTGLSEDNLTKFIASYPEVNLYWLLKDEGEMLSKSSKVKISDERDPYIIELQKKLLQDQDEKIKTLSKNISKLKKAQESNTDMYKVAESNPKLKQ